MKKIILFMLMLSPFANSDMDYVCNIQANFKSQISKEDIKYVEDQMRNYKCERNMILQLIVSSYEGKTTVFKDRELTKLSNLFCRFDRNRDVKHNTLSCVIYSPKARTPMRTWSKFS